MAYFKTRKITVVWIQKKPLKNARNGHQNKLARTTPQKQTRDGAGTPRSALTAVLDGSGCGTGGEEEEEHRRRGEEKELEVLLGRHRWLSGVAASRAQQMD